MAHIGLVDLGVGRYVHETPSRRYPVYTRGNAGEVFPEVAYPLTISRSRAGGSDPFRDAALVAGIVTRADLVDGPVCAGGCFGGYMYLNLSFSRMLAVRTPGLSIADSDATYLGSETMAPAHRPDRRDRNLRCSLRALRFGWRMLGITEVPQLVDDRRIADAWQRRVPELLASDDASLLAALRQLTGPTTALFTNHLVVSGQAGAAVQVLAQICERRLADRSLALTMLAGLGDVDSAAPSWALWELGRLVAANPELDALFDAGLDGLSERLASDPAAAPFADAYARFLDRFGSRGPNEWETACETWGTEPALALVLVDRMRLADDAHAPDHRAMELARTRVKVTEEARGRLRRIDRWVFARALTSASVLSQARERSKTTVVDLIHVSRVLGRELAARVAARTPAGVWEDMWFVLDQELDEFIADPAAFTERIAARRATRQELARRVPPFVFTGTMPPVAEWPLRADVGLLEPASPGTVLAGLGGCAGVAEGRARIVTDPGEPGDLGPGDVLIAPLTDPSWTPLFVPVEAVVVDVGGQMSHAVIVARELGRPCVVAVTDATRRIADGALVRVDGAAGTVTILEASIGQVKAGGSTAP